MEEEEEEDEGIEREEDDQRFRLGLTQSRNVYFLLSTPSLNRRFHTLYFIFLFNCN